MTTNKVHSTGVEAFPLVDADASVASALVSVVRRLTTATSVEEIMATVTPVARTLLAADGVTFVLREGNLCYYAEEDAISPLWKGRRFPLEACISGWCMQYAQGVRITDIYRDARIPQDAYRPTFVRSLTMAPVPRDEPIAAMGAYWAEQRTPSVEELELLQMLADASALAVANVRVSAERETKNTERRELAHRIKNLFAVVQALVQQSEAETLECFREVLVARIEALRRVHAELFRSCVDRVGLDELLHELFTAVGVGEDGRLQLSGPAVELQGDVAQHVALMANELATNAVKHGALSVPEGWVDVGWEYDGEVLRLHWKEAGGPPVTPPVRPGFGIRYLEGSGAYQMGGEAELRFEPDGFRCELTLRVADH